MLELAAMRWLWLEKKCLVVLEERTPSYMMGQPDVLGITSGRYMIEVEIKRSVSDFRADAKKSHRVNRKFYISQQPRQFYYLMEKCLAEKLEQEIPDWAGLMACDSIYNATVIKQAPVNKDSKKLDVKQCARLARQMTSHVMGYALANHSIKDNYKNAVGFDFTDWVGCEKGTFVI